MKYIVKHEGSYDSGRVVTNIYQDKVNFDNLAARVVSEYTGESKEQVPIWKLFVGERKDADPKIHQYFITNPLVSLTNIINKESTWVVIPREHKQWVDDVVSELEKLTS